MGRSDFLVLSLLLILVVVAVVSTTGVKDLITGFVSEWTYGSRTTGIRDISETDGADKKVCGTCHSDKSADFKRRYQHAPFAKWQCTDCHVPHTLGTGKYEFVVPIDKLCSSCHFDRKGEFTMKTQHPPFAKGRCTDCHDPHASDVPKMLRVDQKMLCQSCHVLNMKYAKLPYKHAPFDKGFCSDCHSAHASPYKGLTRLGGDQLCFSCHYDRLAERSAPVQHKPFKEGNCTGCHGPHATAGAKMLWFPKEQLCFRCHVDKAKESKVGYQHKPFVEGKCTDCHVAHGSFNEYLILQPRSQLCYMCHPQYRTVFSQASHHPVGNGLLECYGCHDPHSGPGKRMTRAAGNQLCYICHLNLEPTYEKLAHATKAQGKAGKGSCLNCHVPHGAPVKPLLPDKQEVVCGKCHGKVVKAPITHPVGDKYVDPWHGGKMKCTSCHGPHGTMYKKFTLLPDAGFCLKCHGQKTKQNPAYYSVHRIVPSLKEPKVKTVKTGIPENIRDPKKGNYNAEVRNSARP